ncbi:hypothetical protein [Aureispira sp. CCB-QB1]|uniref:hypothetical protein n=1 Tax=Aureispira sp. CCB-QB1 TaxID=1313421 RepID=UPI0006973446|nr:hypothetical protein [Aureispira sp. CCB-QB1]
MKKILLLLLLTIYSKVSFAQSSKNNSKSVFIAGVRMSDNNFVDLTEFITGYLENDFLAMNIPIYNENLAGSILSIKQKWLNSENHIKPSDFTFDSSDKQNLPSYAIFGTIKFLNRTDIYFYTLEIYSLKESGSKYIYQKIAGDDFRFTKSEANKSHSKEFEDKIRTIHISLGNQLRERWEEKRFASPLSLD